MQNCEILKRRSGKFFTAKLRTKGYVSWCDKFHLSVDRRKWIVKSLSSLYEFETQIIVQHLLKISGIFKRQIPRI